MAEGLNGREDAPQGGAAEDNRVDGVALAGDEPHSAAIPDWVRSATPEDLAPALEALCFAVNRALTLAEAAAVLGRTPAHVAEAAEALSARLRGRGMMLQRHHDEIQMVTRPEVAWAVQRALNPEKPGRLSRPALETLAIVAYRQPATRAAIEAIRGVNCEAVLDSLERRGLVAEVGRAEAPGHPRLFGTTLRFLQMVGLERIDDLPPMPADLLIPSLDADSEDGVLEVAGHADPVERPGESADGVADGSTDVGLQHAHPLEGARR